MKMLLVIALGSAVLPAFGQGHSHLDGTGIKEISFLEGNWHGKQNFNTGGAPMVGEITNHIEEAVGGRYLTEKLATTLPGRKATDVRHFITYDKDAKVYKAWWFNDTKIGPMEFEGNLEGHKLVFLTHGGPGTTQLRATYNQTSPTTLTFTFEMAADKGWQLLFTSEYSKSG